MIFKHPGKPVRNAVRIRDALDIRGDGGYIVVPPSTHPSGHRYRWDYEHEMGWGLPLAPLPDGVLKVLTSSDGNGRGPAPSIPEIIAEGARNATLASLAGSMRRRGATATEILAALRVANDERCQPPLEDRELEQIADSISGLYEPEPLRTNEENEQSRRAAGKSATFIRNERRNDTEEVGSGGLYSSTSFVRTPLWPEPLGEDAYYGILGEIVRTLESDTEASAVAILAHLLPMVGNVIGRRPYYQVEGDHHYTNDNVIVVGGTAQAKGSALGRARKLLRLAAPDYVKTRMLSGLSSGEGLIWAVRDPIQKEEAVREKGTPTGEYRSVVVDRGVTDKRLLVVETGFASVLRMLQRDGNTLSALIRQAWEVGNLYSMVEQS